jgi:hypothetical protein
MTPCQYTHLHIYLTNPCVSLAPCNREWHMGNNRQHAYRTPHSGIHCVCTCKKARSNMPLKHKRLYMEFLDISLHHKLCIDITSTLVNKNLCTTIVSNSFALSFLYWGYANVDFSRGPRTTLRWCSQGNGPSVKPYLSYSYAVSVDYLDLIHERG